ncbi:hypothetical protein [Saccharopolyspora sp. 6V]|uniref:hypothetical protein n=1 Tax=Saccharopolyspora sp. 6V TaxID=2877239 RepID=UPI001CD39318|nr:hypothetical protein [Saccharopolyspora sp. 6V]MCA1195141.1 hypothetical protein [Saccharopolyspora sp. 6V]
MTIPHVPAGGDLESAAQNALIDQANASAQLAAQLADTNIAIQEAIGAHENRLDELETAPAPSIGDVTGLSAALAGKAAAEHTHDVADVDGLAGQLAAKATTSATDALALRLDAVEQAEPPALGDLANVTTTDAVAGQVLKYTGTTWAPGTDNTGGGGEGGATTLDELADVSTTGAADGRALVYSGGTWSPAAPVPAEHTHAITAVTGLRSELDALAARVDTHATDTELYGDVISSHRRTDCVWGESVSNGFMTAVATRSPKTFTASQLRLCVTSAASGSGTFDVKVYTGSSLANLAERSFRFGSEHLTTTGVKRVSIDSTAITAGQYVAVCMIVTGFTAAPRLSSTPTGTGAQLLIGEQPYSVYQANQTFPPPTTLNTTATAWTRANQLFWFALA